jgi:hypothetical protein
MKAGGSVKKRAIGGDTPGKGYSGFPHSPTSKVDSAVSAHKKGGSVKKRAEGGDVEGGEVEKAQFGGGMGAPGGGAGNVVSPGGSGLMGLFPGRQPVPAQQGATNVSGRQAIPFSQPVTVPMGRMATSVLARPAPGTTTSYAKKGGAIYKKKGGAVGDAKHGDEAEDKKLFGKMLKAEEKKEKGMKSGGFVPKNQESKDPGLEGTKYRNQGKGYADGGSIHGAGSATGRLARNAKVPAKTEL